MSIDGIDDIFRKELENTEKLPEGLAWNKDASWERFEERSKRKHLHIYSWLAAASITIIMGIGLLFYINNISRTTCISSSSDGVVKELILKGGHKCYLSSGSKIQYCYSKKANISDTLYLTGEAYFETSDVRRLVVMAKNTITNCSASALNIRAGDDDKTSIISVISGSVIARCTESDFPEMQIQNNERCVIYADGIFASKEPNTDPNFLAWKTGTLTFDNTPLKYAIQTIEEYYGVSIEVRSLDLKYCNYTSKFNHSGLDEVLGNIQQVFNTKAEKNKNAIVLEGGICKGN